jgi:hypothetical protein
MSLALPTEGAPVLIVYCDSCGTLLKTESNSIKQRCADCSSGILKIRREKDSGEICMARRPTASKILRKIRRHLP